MENAEEYSNAEKAYTTAIKKNDNFFSPYLARGVLLYERGERAKAKSDLQPQLSITADTNSQLLSGELSLAGQAVRSGKQLF